MSSENYQPERIEFISKSMPHSRHLISKYEDDVGEDLTPRRRVIHLNKRCFWELVLI
jgi:hypothetical protein